MALSLTTAIWAYVPSLLIAELAFEMESPEHLSRSIALSAGLNVATFLAVGLSVCTLGHRLQGLGHLQVRRHRVPWLWLVKT